MRSFLFKLLLIALPGALMTVVNVMVDPAHVIREGPERQAAAMLSSGTAVGGLLNYDERQVVKYTIDALTSRRDVAVVGSSRAMQIRAGMFPNESFLNSSVSAPVIEDILAVVGEYDARGLLPRRVVLGLDPWLMNEHAPRASRAALVDGYRTMLGRIGMPPVDLPKKPPLETLRVIASPAYFQAALREMKWRRSLVADLYRATDEDGALMPDGSLRYPRSVRDRTPPQVLTAIVRASAGEDEYMKNFTGIGHHEQAQVEGLLRYLRARGVSVDLYLAPYHPRVPALFANTPGYRMVPAVEAYYRRVAVALGIRVLGSYDAGACRCTEADFFDAVHPRESCVQRILAQAGRGG